MSRKFGISITQGNHTFTIEGCDSFDEALKLVNKGIYDFNLANLPKNPVIARPGGDIMGGNDNVSNTVVGPKVVKQ